MPPSAPDEPPVEQLTTRPYHSGSSSSSRPPSPRAPFPSSKSFTQKLGITIAVLLCLTLFLAAIFFGALLLAGLLLVFVPLLVVLRLFRGSSRKPRS